jgi:hypothetical protein
MKIRRSMLLSVAAFFVLPVLAMAQSLVDPRDASETYVARTQPQSEIIYVRPTQKVKLRNYVCDAFGPYPIVGAAVAAGVNQADNSLPERKQGAEGYGNFRMGNYSLLAYEGGNIALEFLYSGTYSLSTRMHLNNGHGAPSAGSQPWSTANSERLPI